ncbi:hypothetical protein [Streptomyces sanyensis]|uniref:Uncharacterized protein n=1 Tax=Streptomyces sanyensis TaxID=568869 RepID=A0ABP9AE51_9ACTN
MSLPRPAGGGSGPEAVPFAFVAEADAFRSNVAPPPRRRASAGELLGRAMVGMAVVGGIVGALLLGVPALDTEQAPGRTQTSEAAPGR